MPKKSPKVPSKRQLREAACAEARAAVAAAGPSSSGDGGGGAVTRLPASVCAGCTMPYTTLVRVSAQQSAMRGAGTGMFAQERLAPFTWVGFYPGKVVSSLCLLAPGTGGAAGGAASVTTNMHTMGTAGGALVIIADPAIRTGVHMINEASAPLLANVWYAKLANGYVLYFAGGAGVEAGAEMLTCYSRTYGKRPYPIAAKGECSDPRCCGVANHRRHSELGLSPGEWRGALMAKHPRELHVLPESIWDVRGQQRDQDKKEKTGI